MSFMKAPIRSNSNIHVDGSEIKWKFTQSQNNPNLIILALEDEFSNAIVQVWMTKDQFFALNGQTAITREQLTLAGEIK